MEHPIITIPNLSDTVITEADLDEVKLFCDKAQINYNYLSKLQVWNIKKILPLLVGIKSFVFMLQYDVDDEYTFRAIYDPYLIISITYYGDILILYIPNDK